MNFDSSSSMNLVVHRRTAQSHMGGNRPVDQARKRHRDEARWAALLQEKYETTVLHDLTNLTDVLAAASGAAS